MNIGFNATMPLSVLNFEKRQVQQKDDERKRLNGTFVSTSIDDNLNIDSKNDMNKAAGTSSGMCQKYGAESGDAPGWLKMTPVLRSEDELETYMSVVHAYVPSPEPKSYRSESWKQKASGCWESKIQEPNNVFQRTLQSTRLKAKEQECVEQPLGLWRPTGNRCIKSGITEDDHICLEKNGHHFASVVVGKPLETDRYLHPSKFHSHR
tara:strand:+ start:92 stop:715 length:624 start_codon:yes stop_codon:yes gene_type:complete